ncbi:hypothetical protein D3C81_766450 [compost metagenome]
MAAACQQGDAEAFLQQANLLADGPRRHPHALGSGFEAAQAGGFAESTQGKQWQNGTH